MSDFQIFTDFYRPPHPRFNDGVNNGSEAPLYLSLIIEPGVRGLERWRKKV